MSRLKGRGRGTGGKQGNDKSPEGKEIAEFHDERIITVFRCPFFSRVRHKEGRYLIALPMWRQ
jgi:hypothetical protein